MSATDHRLVASTLCYTESKASGISKISSAKHIITDLGKCEEPFVTQVSQVQSVMGLMDSLNQSF